MMLTNWLEPVGNTGRGGGKLNGREKSSGTSIENPAQ
jgi:hypothetical protein